MSEFTALRGDAKVKYTRHDLSGAVQRYEYLADQQKWSPTLAKDVQAIFVKEGDKEVRFNADAAVFDIGRLESSFGFVFDHASPIGEIVLASPTHHRIGLR